MKRVPGARHYRESWEVNLEGETQNDEDIETVPSNKLSDDKMEEKGKGRNVGISVSTRRS